MKRYCVRFLKQEGFTLLEMIMALVILTIIMVTLTPLFRNNIELYLQTAAISESGQSARIAFNRLLMDLRHLNTLTSGTSSSISFVDINNNTLNYSVSGSNLMLNGNVAADNVNSLIFEYLDVNGITCSSSDPAIWIIRLTLDFDIKGSTQTYAMEIQPRNWQRAI